MVYCRAGFPDRPNQKLHHGGDPRRGGLSAQLAFPLVPALTSVSPPRGAGRLLDSSSTSPTGAVMVAYGARPSSVSSFTSDRAVFTVRALDGGAISSRQSRSRCGREYASRAHQETVWEGERQDARPYDRPGESGSDNDEDTARRRSRASGEETRRTVDLELSLSLRRLRAGSAGASAVMLFCPPNSRSATVLVTLKPPAVEGATLSFLRNRLWGSGACCRVDSPGICLPASVRRARPPCPSVRARRPSAGSLQPLCSPKVDERSRARSVRPASALPPRGARPASRGAGDGGISEPQGKNKARLAHHPDGGATRPEGGCSRWGAGSSPARPALRRWRRGGRRRCRWAGRGS